MFLGRYKKGETVRYAVNFHDPSTGAAADPTSPAAEQCDTAGTWTTLTAPAKINAKTGHYGGSIVTDSGWTSGVYLLRVAGTVGGVVQAAELSFEVVAARAEDLSSDLSAVKTKTDQLAFTDGRSQAILSVGQQQVITDARDAARIAIKQAINPLGVEYFDPADFSAALSDPSALSPGSSITIKSGLLVWSGTGWTVEVDAATATTPLTWGTLDSDNVWTPTAEFVALEGTIIDCEVIHCEVGGRVLKGVTLALSGRFNGYGGAAQDMPVYRFFVPGTDDEHFSPCADGSVWLRNAISNLQFRVSSLTNEYLAHIPTNPLLANDARLDNLDAPISDTLAAASYTAPDNPGISAIKAKTDNLPASPAAVGDAMTLTEVYDAAKNAASAEVLSLVAIEVSGKLDSSAYIIPDNSKISAIKLRTDLIPDNPAQQGSLDTLISLYKNTPDLITYGVDGVSTINWSNGDVWNHLYTDGKLTSIDIIEGS